MPVKAETISGVNEAEALFTKPALSGPFEYKEWIPLQEWSAVENAVWEFSKGELTSERKARRIEHARVLSRGFAESARSEGQSIFGLLVGGGLIPSATSEASKEYTQSLLQDARDVLSKKMQWKLKPDECPGAFWKTELVIQRINMLQDTFLLSVEDKSGTYGYLEADLAERLSIERGLLEIGLNVEFPSPDGAFDFRSVFDPLRSVLRTLGYRTADYIQDPNDVHHKGYLGIEDLLVPPSDLTHKICFPKKRISAGRLFPDDFARAPWIDESEEYALGVRDGALLTVQLDTRAHRGRNEGTGLRSKWQDTWRIEGSKVMFNGEKTYGNPIAKFRVLPYGRPFLAIEPHQRNSMRELTSDVVTAFK